MFALLSAALPAQTFDESGLDYDIIEPEPVVKPPVTNHGNTLTLAVHVPAFSGFYEDVIEPTLQTLQAALPGFQIELHLLDEAALTQTALKKQADFFIVSSGFFTYLEHSGATPLASLRVPQSSPDGLSAGAVFLARSNDNRYTKTVDLRSTLVAALSAQSFAGWIAALGEIANVTPYPKNFFGKTFFLGPDPGDVTDALAAHKVDVAVLPACTFEAMIREKRVSKADFRVIGARETPGFSCAVSTRLYPGFVIGSREGVSAEIKNKVSGALLSMTGAKHGYSWNTPDNLTDVRSLVDRIGFTPTENRGHSSATLDRYKYALLISALLLAAAVAYGCSVSYIVAQRTQKLRRVIDEKNRLEETAQAERERFAQIERAGFVSEISSMIAHELRQPVASLINYADGLSLHLSGRQHDPIVTEATREIIRQSELVASIVDRVRAYAKNNTSRDRTIDLCRVVRLGFNSFRSGSDLTGVRILSELPESAWVKGDDLELELLVVNCLKNALHAVRRRADHNGIIRVSVEKDPQKNTDWLLRIADNGPKISARQLAELTQPVTSDKLEGLGLGLCISRAVAERHAARLEFTLADSSDGLTVTLHIASADAPATGENHV